MRHPSLTLHRLGLSLTVTAAALIAPAATSTVTAASPLPVTAGVTTPGSPRAIDRAAAPCGQQPTTTSTGARGPLRSRGPLTVGSGRTVQDVRVPAMELAGDDITVRNVVVDGTLLVTGQHVRIRRATAKEIYVSSGSHVTVTRSKIENSTEDAFHVSSDRGALVRDVTLRSNYVHRPVTPSANHYDGIQVRGVDGLTISCTVFQAGPYHDNFNAAVFLENANGGSENVVVSNNWMFGFAFSIMVDSPSATFTNNTIGGDIKWGPCLLLHSSGSRGFKSGGNTWAGSGKKVNFCHQG